MKRGIIALSLLFLISLVQTVSAPEIDLTEFDDRMGDALGIGAFGGGLLVSLIILFIVLGCLGAISKRRPSNLETTVVAIAVFSFCIAAGWFPVWSVIFVLMVIAFLFGKTVLRGLG